MVPFYYLINKEILLSKEIIMNYPTIEEYAFLYKKYLQGTRSEQMINLVPFNLNNTKVLDICGGGGRISNLVLEKGAEVVLVDNCANMTKNLKNTNKFKMSHLSINSYLIEKVKDVKSKISEPFDVAFCQQAINYWFNFENIALLSYCLNQGGVFIFNTFNTKPESYPIPKEYTLDNIKYMELSWLIHGKTVQHVQIAEGITVHTTQFKWVSPEEFQQVLSHFFDLSTINEGKSTIYVCVKK